MNPADPADELALLIRSRHPLITIETVEEARARELIRRVADRLDLPLYEWSVTSGLRNRLAQPQDALPNTEAADRAIGHLRFTEFQGVYVFNDLLPHLTSPLDKRLLREVVEAASAKRQCIILIEQNVNLEPALTRLAAPFTLALPDEAQIKQLILDVCRKANKEFRLKVDIKPSEYDTLVRNLRGLTEDEIRRSVWRAVIHDERLDGTDVPAALRTKQDMLKSTGTLEYIVPEASLADVGGLDRLKGWLKQRENALSAAAREFGVPPPRGILLLGVQGAGKSLAAKATAASWGLPLLRLDPGALYDKYVGQTEKHLRQALATAEALAPVVLWIDEIEKAFASAAAQSNDGGLSQRMFGTLLTWLQDQKHPIFVVATANDISALPPELMRKGRFDEIFFVDLPRPRAREAIFKVHLERRKRNASQFDLPSLAKASEGFSGAEIEQAVVSGLYTAFAAGKELDTAILLQEIAQTRPLSVTMAERIATLRQWAAERCVSAD
ncbi:MAG TPA: AAA family ATPase [Planctomycetota bacterium]|nr:AAA family ATPase [Planctomycetota bacterium]